MITKQAFVQVLSLGDKAALTWQDKQELLASLPSSGTAVPTRIHMFLT